jgi:CPA2 family monovalent cation:H+ antiporter-2
LQPSLQPFLGGLEGAAVFLALLAVLGISFWRSAVNLEGHVRAGAQMIVEALGSQLHAAPATASPEAAAMEAGQLDRLLPGLGAPMPVRLDPESPAVGRSLGTLNLRAVSGATVLVILRGEQGVVPSAGTVLQAGDVLALAGSQEALRTARELLRGGS